MIYLTQEGLDAGLAKWQAILHLEDWEITATLVPQTTWEDRGQMGDCSVQTLQFAALIRLATFDTLDRIGYRAVDDMERTLVHELLHCVFRAHQLFDGDRPEDGQKSAYEHAIEQTARAFVELDRRAFLPSFTYHVTTSGVVASGGSK